MGKMRACFFLWKNLESLHLCCLPRVRMYVRGLLAGLRFSPAESHKPGSVSCKHLRRVLFYFVLGGLGGQKLFSSYHTIRQIWGGASKGERTVFHDSLMPTLLSLAPFTRSEHLFSQLSRWFCVYPHFASSSDHDRSS